MSLLFESETYKVIGAFINVHKSLGNGFLESMYQEALEIEFSKQKIPFSKQKRLNILFDGKPLDKFFVADFVCYESIFLEIKASRFLLSDNASQVLNYSKATGLPVGLLINFGESSLRWKRFINTPNQSV